MHKIVSTFVLILVHFQIFAAAAGAASKFLPGAGAA
jgi:hypothetical protein